MVTHRLDQRVLVFCISGHGFGHATRCLEVIHQLHELDPDCHIVVRSSLPRGFLEHAARTPITVESADLDTGIVQIDSLHSNAIETARRAAAFYADFGARVQREAVELRRRHVSAVVGDVPPLAFAAAEHARIPSIAVANFTWDWIYEAYTDFASAAPGVIELIRGAYSATSMTLRLPFHGGFQGMSHVRDVPLVARRSRLGRDGVRMRLALPSSRPVVLASFGGHRTPLDLGAIADQNDVTLLATEHEAPTAGASHDRFRSFSQNELSARDLRYEDLVAAADVVVAKPGYGTVSECIANETAMLYTSRGAFAENDVIVPAMARLLRCRYIAPDDLRAGKWQAAIETLLSQPAPGERMDSNGASLVAREILQAATSN